MKIALVTSKERGKIDDLLTEVAQELQSEGASLAGVVRVPGYVCSAENGCDMSVRVLPEGPNIKITQDLGSGSGACRLDPAGIVRAVSEVERRPLENTELFFLNKFGPEEAAGKGFRAVIGAALEQGVPVVVGVGAASREAFEAFSAGVATVLTDDKEAILDWSRSAMAAT